MMRSFVPIPPAAMDRRVLPSPAPVPRGAGARHPSSDFIYQVTPRGAGASHSSVLGRHPLNGDSVSRIEPRPTPLSALGSITLDPGGFDDPDLEDLRDWKDPVQGEPATEPATPSPTWAGPVVNPPANTKPPKQKIVLALTY